MGEAILLGACLTGLQGLRGPLGWEPAKAAGTNNVISSNCRRISRLRGSWLPVSDINTSCL